MPGHVSAYEIMAAFPRQVRLRHRAIKNNYDIAFEENAPSGACLLGMMAIRVISRRRTSKPSDEQASANIHTLKQESSRRSPPDMLPGAFFRRLMTELMI